MSIKTLLHCATSTPPQSSGHLVLVIIVLNKDVKPTTARRPPKRLLKLLILRSLLEPSNLTKLLTSLVKPRQASLCSIQTSHLRSVNSLNSQTPRLIIYIPILNERCRYTTCRRSSITIEHPIIQYQSTFSIDSAITRKENKNALLYYPVVMQTVYAPASALPAPVRDSSALVWKYSVLIHRHIERF